MDSVQRYLDKTDADVRCVCGQYREQRVDPYAAITSKDKAV